MLRPSRALETGAVQRSPESREQRVECPIRGVGARFDVLAVHGEPSEVDDQVGEVERGEIRRDAAVHFRHIQHPLRARAMPLGPCGRTRGTEWDEQQCTRQRRAYEQCCQAISNDGPSGLAYEVHRHCSTIPGDERDR
jgi:hypothetical protein